MKIAIVGGGISGLVAARGLCREHEVTVFEAAARPGGHSHTVTVEEGGVARALDTGFLVFNRRDYPRFDALMTELGVASQPTCMSFSVRVSGNGLEYGGATLGALFCQKRNAVRPGFARMLRDIGRFYREGRARVAALGEEATIADLVREAGYSREFVDWHLFPLGSALWSAPREAFRRYPARFVVEFFDRHDLLELNLNRRVRWRTITGGSQRYVERLIAPFRDRLRLRAPVRAVSRSAEGVRLRSEAGEERFDQVVFACHGHDALAMLADASPAEREILGAVRYQSNDVVLHTDARLLPARRPAWASWNYHVRPDRDLATVTYDLNRLQGIESATRYCVTLNETDAIDPARILGRFRYAHPQYSVEWVRRRRDVGRIQGARRAWFCGAYFGNGFHEDGVASAEAVVQGIERRFATAGSKSGDTDRYEAAAARAS